MATSLVGKTRISRKKASRTVASTHGVPAIHLESGDKCVVFTEGTVPKKVIAAIYKRQPDDIFGNKVWSGPQHFEVGLPGMGVYAGNESCENPWVVQIDDGFALFFVRRNTSIGNTTMTIGASLEMVKLTRSEEGEYTMHRGSQAGKGIVLDNQIISGDVQTTPRAAWFGSNTVAVVYGHQVSYALTGGTVHDRVCAVRGAYLDFTLDVNGKPVILSNRTGGSVSDAVDGGYAAGSSTSLLNAGAVDVDDAAATPVFFNAGGCLLADCCQDPRGDLLVVYEARSGGSGTGGIAMRCYKGPGRGSQLGTQIYADTASNAVTATFAARRPILAYRHLSESVADIPGTDYPPVILAFGEVDPADVDNNTNTVKGKKITYPLNGAAAPTVTDITIPSNAPYSATAAQQLFPFAVESDFVAGLFVQNLMAIGTGGEGRRFMLVHSDNDVDHLLMGHVTFPHRINAVAERLRDGTKILLVSYEGQNVAGSDSEEIFLTGWIY